MNNLLSNKKVSRKQVEDSARFQSFGVIRPIAIGLTILYALLTVAHYFALTGSTRSHMMVVSGASSTLALLISMWHQFERRKGTRFNPHFMVEVLVGIGVFNCFAHQLYVPEPHHSTNLVLATLAASMVIWRRRYVFVLISLTWAHFWYVTQRGESSPLWGHFGFALFMAQFVAILNYVVRRRTVYQFEKLRNEQLESNRKLREGERLAGIGEVAAVMAHEINNPLAIVSLQLQAMHRIMAKNNLNIDEFTKALARADRASERIALLVGKLLHSTREEQGGDIERAAMTHLLNDVVIEFRKRIEGLGVQVSFVSPAMEGWCYMRKAHVISILYKILDNALDAVQNFSEAKIEIGFDKIKLGTTEKVRVWVSNSSKKIPKEVLDKIFTPLFTTKVGGGRGLSLSVAKAQAEAMGAELAVENNNKMTTFILTLPTKSEKSEVTRAKIAS